MWVRLDDSLPDDPSVAVAGSEAFGALVQGLCYSNRNLTDGWVPEAVMRSRFLASSTREAADEAIARLLRVCLLSPAEREGLPGYQIAERLTSLQPTREQILRQRADRSSQKAAAGRLGGFASGKARRKQTRSKTEADAKHGASKHEAPIPIPIPEEKSTSADANASSTPLPRGDAPTSALLDKLFHEVWEAEDNTSDRAEAVKALLAQRSMKADPNEIIASERRVSFLRMATTGAAARRGDFTRIGAR